MPKNTILIISGTNRPDSNTKKIADLVHEHYRSAKIDDVEMYSLTEMPREIFDASSYVTKPAGWDKVQQRIVDAAGLHIVTPEYNGGMPGVLKYFIDMLKFPESFEKKPVAFTGVAAGLWGALRPVEQLQMVFSYRNAHLFPDRVFIPGIGQKLDAQGKLNDMSINERLQQQAVGFAKFARHMQTHTNV